MAKQWANTQYLTLPEICSATTMSAQAYRQGVGYINVRSGDTSFVVTASRAALCATLLSFLLRWR
jgi:hypothetical protein